ncbi:MAG TPA: RDD family protein [Coleofasciculaceae cyanobacterium]|jgi:uncharacterized RDD family membrane protein YckC
MEFRSIHTVETADHIQLKVELAGLANRLFAYLIDSLVMMSMMGVLVLVFTLPAFLRGTPELSKTAMPLGMFLIIFGYHLVQEWLWNGKTIGKNIMGIRVVRNDAQPIGFWESLGRNLLRVLDVYVSGIGLLVMLFNPDEKRLGDFLAGTIVINDQPVLKPSRPQWTPPEPAADEGMLTAACQLSPEEAELLKAYHTRRAGLFAESRRKIASALCRYLSERLHQPVENEAALDALLADYARQR